MRSSVCVQDLCLAKAGRSYKFCLLSLLTVALTSAHRGSELDAGHMASLASVFRCYSGLKHSTATRQVPGIVSKGDGFMYNEHGTRLGREEDIGLGAEDLLQAAALEEFAGMHCSLSCHSFTLFSQASSLPYPVLGDGT